MIPCDHCGKIGPWPLKIGLGGMFGKDKYYYAPAAGANLNDKTESIYGASFWWYVPIIPEKKGSKAGIFSHVLTRCKASFHVLWNSPIHGTTFHQDRCLGQKYVK